MTENLSVLWADAHWIGLTWGYDHVRLRFVETTGSPVEVVAKGQIGVQVEGFWDETVVQDATVVAAHPFAERCAASIAERLGESAPESGSPERNRGHFETLVVNLIDGSQILCSAAEFIAERSSP